MTTKVIDGMDLSFYPLQPEMSLADIKAVTREQIIIASATIIKEITKTYKGTDYEVNMEKAGKAIEFLTLLKHTGGSLAGIPFRLLPFQVEFVVQVIAVVHRETGFRKHKEAILFIPRKAGKTELGAALTLLMMFLDKEVQKEIYSIASETQQAAILYHALISMLKQEPMLWNMVKQYKAEKKVEREVDGFLDLYRVLSAVAGTKDGLKTSTVLSDEPHSYPDSALYDVVTEGMAHRAEPLAFLLSTAGYNKQGFFHRKLNYAKQVMEGVLEDTAIYLMDFSLDEEDDWTDEELWKKANPALGFGVKMDYLRDKFHKALHSATDEVSFKTKHLNLWVDSAVTWIRSEHWNKSNKLGIIDESSLYGRECYMAVDLSSTTDLTSICLAFPNEDGTYTTLSRFFIPEDTATVRSKEDKVSYLDWAREGWLTLTSGNVIDYDHVFHSIMQDVGNFDVREVAYDRWNATSLVTNLMEEGVVCTGFGQGFKSMSPAIKLTESLVLQEKLNHGNNPILGWCVNNVLIIGDAAENVKIDKGKSQERVDGAVALVMALDRANSFFEPEVDYLSLIG